MSTLILVTSGPPDIKYEASAIPDGADGIENDPRSDSSNKLFEY